MCIPISPPTEQTTSQKRHAVGMARRLAVAPMLGWTDRHERFFLRLITRHTLLYTEMVTTGALLHGDAHRFLNHDPSEHPLALQLGGSDPEALAECARLAEEYGYDEVNLNCGCPSDRVQLGRFGACLFAEPDLVAQCVAAMDQAISIPVTVKTRIGLNGRDSYSDLARFIRTVADAGCETFILHARTAWLGQLPRSPQHVPIQTIPDTADPTTPDRPPNTDPGTDNHPDDSRFQAFPSHRPFIGGHKKRGLNPSQNRTIPPLRYDMVHRLKADFPELPIVLNGGIQDLHSVQQQLAVFDGAMIGRAAYHNPYLLAEADRLIFRDPHPTPSRYQIMEDFIPYVSKQLANEVPLGRMTRHILGLFASQPGAKAWRRYISEYAHRPGAGIEVIHGALDRTSR